MKVSDREIRNMAVKSKIPNRVTLQFDLSRVAPSVKKRVIMALRKGHIMAWSGRAAELYDIVRAAYDVPGVKVCRERTKKYWRNPPTWCFDWSVRSYYSHQPATIPTGKLLDLFTADEVAVRMMEDVEKRKEIEARRGYSYGGGRYGNLFMLKDTKLLTEALAEQLQGHEDKLEAAVQALQQGSIITVNTD